MSAVAALEFPPLAHHENKFSRGPARKYNFYDGFYLYYRHCSHFDRLSQKHPLGD